MSIDPDAISWPLKRFADNVRERLASAEARLSKLEAEAAKTKDQLKSEMLVSIKDVLSHVPTGGFQEFKGGQMGWVSSGMGEFRVPNTNAPLPPDTHRFEPEPAPQREPGLYPVELENGLFKIRRWTSKKRWVNQSGYTVIDASDPVWIGPRIPEPSE